MSKVFDFCTKNNLSEADKTELIELFNECMVHVATGILNLPGVGDAKGAKGAKAKVVKAKADKDERPKCVGQTKAGKDCRNRALENEKFCKTHLPKKDEIIIEPTEDTAECNAVCANGENCKQKGRMMQPDGAEFKYCFKHSKHWKKHEGSDGAKVESDTDSDKDSVKDIKLTDDQDEERLVNGLTEEEYVEASEDYDIRESMAKKGIEEKNFTDAKKDKKMKEWKDDNQIVVDTSEAKVDVKPVEEIRVKKTKRPSGWMKKAKENEAKRALAEEKRNKEMLAGLCESEDEYDDLMK